MWRLWRKKRTKERTGMQVKWKMAVGALALAAWVQIPAWSVESRGEVYVSDSFYDWDGNADSFGSGTAALSPQTSRNQEDYTGPGAAAQGQGTETEEDLVLGVPSVTEVTLKEKYHEAYKVYEESMEDRFFFYTNVGNGGITDKGVILDIPQNMFVTMEKDGALIDYTPGRAVSGYGTYVARLTAIENPDRPFSEQKEYRAIFRFRIQEKPPQEDGEGSEQSPGGSGLGYQVDWESYAGQQSGGSGKTGASGMGSLGFGSGLGGSGMGSGTGAGGESQDGSGPAAGGEGQDGSGSAAGGESQDGSGPAADGEGQDGNGPGESGEDQDGSGPGAGGEDRDGSGLGDGGEGRDGNGSAADNPEDLSGAYQSGLYRPRMQVYNSASGKYEVTFENGRKLVTNIPEGFTGPGAVEFSVSDGEPVQLYRDDSPVEYIPGNSITEPGYYRLDVDGQMWSFVIASSIKDMDRYLAPAGMKITQAAFDGESVEGVSPRYLPMKADGQYEITLTGEEGEGAQVVLVKDTLPPEIRVNVKGGRADIEYLSQDIALITLEKNGQVQEGFGGYVVNEPGSYKLCVTDGAGNVSSRQFTLKYQVNVYGIAAVALVILLIIGGVVFVIHVKRTVKVR